jgi:hypothetical protein
MDMNVFSDSHRRTVSAALKVVERLILEIESGLTSPEQGTMFVLVNDVDEQSKKHSLQIIDEIKSYIIFLYSKYSLSTEKLAVNWMIQINKTKIWEVLCDTTSKRLKNYGGFAEEEAPEFDSYMAKLRNLVEKL